MKTKFNHHSTSVRRRLLGYLSLSILASTALTNAQTVTTWQGDVNTDWDNGGNWGNGVPDAAAGGNPAQFNGSFDDQPSLLSSEPWQTAEMIRVLNPNKDVVITIEGGRQLNIDTYDDNGTADGGDNYGFDMSSAGRNLTITGGGDIMQRNNKIDNGNPALWAVTSTSPIGGDLTIDVDVLRIQDGVEELVIDTAAGRTVDIQAQIASNGAGTLTTSVSITKQGDGTLIFGDNNLFTGKLAVNGGTLSISAGNQLNNAPGVATADSLTLDGGTLAITGTTSVGLTGAANIRRGLTLGAGGGTIAPVAGQQITWDAPITGPGGLTMDGEGIFLLRSSDNTYLGDTWIKRGELRSGTPSGTGNNVIAQTKLTIGDGANSGYFNLNAGNARLTGLETSGTGTANRIANSGGNRTLTLDLAGSNTFAGTIDGSIVIEKDGVGDITLSGANSYVGATNINAGTLNTSSASTGAGSFTVATDATLGVIASPGETLAMSDLTATVSNLDILLDVSNPSAPVADAGALTLNGALTVNVSGLSIVTSGDEIVLLSYDSLAGVGLIVEGTLPTISGYSRTFNHDTVNKKVTLTYTSTQGPIVADMVFPAAVSTIYGTPSGSTSVAVSASNLSDDITATAPAGFEVSNDDTTFGSTAVFTQTAGEASGTLYIRIAAGSLVSGSYDEQTVSLESPGAYTVFVATAASGNEVTPKELTILDAVADNKFFDGNTDATLTANLQAAEDFGTGDSSDGKPYTGDDLVLGVPAGTFASASPGTGIVVTPGDFTLSGDDVGNYTLAQPTGLTADILSLVDLYWDGTGNDNGWGTASRWSTDSGADTPDPVAFPDISSTAIFNTTVENTDQNVFLNGNRAAGGMIFNSTGIVAIKGHTNGTSNQSLQVGARGITVNTGAGLVTIGDAATEADIAMSAAQTWELAAGTTMAVVNTVSGSFDLNKAGAGNLILSGSNTYAGDTIVGNGSLVLSDGGAFGSGNIVLGDGVNSGTLTISQTTNLDLGDKVISGTGTLIKNESGVLTLEGATNTFDGSTQVLGGTLTITGDDGLGAAPAAVVADAILLDGGTLNTRMVGSLGGGFTINANRGITLGAGGGTIQNTTPSGAFSATFDGVITGVGSLTKASGQALMLGGDSDFTGGINVTGGNLHLSGNNTFTGDINIDGGNLRVENVGALNAAAPNAVNIDANNLILTGNSITISGLSGAGGNVQNLNDTAAALTVDQASDLAYDGNLIDGTGTGALSLVKDGIGTMTLNGINTYTGTTQVNEGCLILGQAAASPDNGLTTSVAAGAGFGFNPAGLSDAEIKTIVDNVTWDAASDLVFTVNTPDTEAVSADLSGFDGNTIVLKGDGTLNLTGATLPPGVAFESPDGGSIVLGIVVIDSVTTEPGTVSGIKVTLDFTSSGDVDAYASDTLLPGSWSLVKSSISSSPDVVEDNVSAAAKFYVLVPAGSGNPYP
ncbi:MAG: beta strand repeat-containing protein [Luteolibacter sp.]